MSKAPAKSLAKSAALLGKEIPAERLHPRVLAWITQHAKDQEPWAVAVSGGLDSVALLLLLWAHFPKKRKQLLVLHFDHAVRKDSAADVEFVRALAKSLGVAFFTARRPPGGLVNEAALRDARWKFFREQMDASKARLIFFGHQRDDVAETILMRLARGGGASSLSSLRPVRDFPNGIVTLRPLLDISHKELGQTLTACGVKWHEDSTNAQDHFLRNRIRHQVIPAWRVAEASRDLDAAVARTRNALEDDADALENITAALMHGLSPGEPMALAHLAKQPRAICRRALSWWLHLNGIRENLNTRAFDTLFDATLAAQPGRWSAGPGHWIVLDGNALSLIGGAQPATDVSWGPHVLKPGQTLSLPDGAQLSAKIVTVDQKLLKELKSGKMDPAKTTYLALPAKAVTPALQVRSWQPGDRYRPLGAPGRRKLQDMFTDKKIPLKERKRLPVVCTEDDEPLWVPGLPPAHARRVAATTRSALALTYRT